MSKSSTATTTADLEHLPAPRASAGDAPARVERRDALFRFLTDPPRDVAEAVLAVREAAEVYGNDTERELADLEAGRHPLHRPKADGVAPLWADESDAEHDAFQLALQRLPALKLGETPERLRCHLLVSAMPEAALAEVEEDLREMYQHYVSPAVGAEPMPSPPEPVTASVIDHIKT